MRVLKRTTISTTEPYTNPDGTWVAATFKYSSSLRFDRQDLVERNWLAGYLNFRVMKYLKDEAMEWRSGLPLLHIGEGFPRLDMVESQDFDMIWLSFVMQGTFALSHNDTRNTRMLVLIDKPVEKSEILNWHAFEASLPR